jgi:hypothetical protein
MKRMLEIRRTYTLRCWVAILRLSISGLAGTIAQRGAVEQGPDLFSLDEPRASRRLSSNPLNTTPPKKGKLHGP